MKTAVITTVHGRSAHLRNQRVGLDRGTSPIDLHVVVAMDDPCAADVVRDGAPPTVLVDCDTGGGALPLARARNTGARVAVDDGAELLIFLDVDCIPGPDLASRYRQTTADLDHADALLCGPVSYLPPPGTQGYPLGRLAQLSRPHPARPCPPGHQVVAGSDYRLFWSLSFAVTTPTWVQTGGFCEEYRGYGGEDTDFAQTAAARGIGLRWVGGADAFHQYHPVSDPPIEHLDDILRNAAVFHRRWGWWPMEGWLRSFQQLGLIERASDGTPFRSPAEGLAPAGQGIPCS
ncbi:galactosyltransferase-related protein [Mycobacterium sp. AMU20-3851]|uniref:glycosyltransferase family 2 protein n=1 Tax=Mycobacterium sp. AMU20-3851 TaxID=3122055 RepID=UPI003754C3DD